MRLATSRSAGAIALLVALGSPRAAAALGGAGTSTATAGLPELPGFAALEPPAPRPLRLEHLALTVGGFVATAGLILLVPEPPSGWKRDLPLDRAFFDLFGSASAAQRERLSDLSTVLQGGLLTLPALDLALTPTLLGRDPELAWQMAWMNLEAFSASTAIMILTKRLVGRVRPLIPACEGTDDFGCHSNASRRSFISGHTTASFTAAGLVCLHHTQLELFGGGLPDKLTCAAALGLAATTGALRVASEQHYITDVLAGAAVGLAAGWLLPWLIHYGGEDDPDDEPSPRPPGEPGRIELSLLGGVLSSGAGTHAVGGLEASLLLRHWFDEELLAQATGLELAVRGALLYTTRADDSAGLRQLTQSGRLRVGPIGVGAAVDFRSRVAGDDGALEVLAGPELSLTVWGAPGPVIVTTRWLPLLDGAEDLFALEVEVPLTTHLGARFAAQTLLPIPGVDGSDGALALLGAGGRLPW